MSTLGVAYAPATDPKAAAFAQYDRTMRRRAARIAAGLALLIIGPALGLVVEGLVPALDEPTNRFAVFMGTVGLAAGVILFYLGNRTLNEFVRANPIIEDRYTGAEQRYDARTLGIGVLVGVALVFAGAGLGGMLLAPANQQLGTGVLLAFLGASVWVFSYTVCLTGRSVFRRHEDGRTVNLHAEKQRHELAGRICFAIMAVATLVGLAQLATPGMRGEFFWLAWAVGGALCGLVAVVASAHERSSQGIVR